MTVRSVYVIGPDKKLKLTLTTYTKGHAIVGVSSWPFKCPAAPSETALMLHDYLTDRGVQVAAASIIADIQNGPQPLPFRGIASCYIEFGAGRVGKVDMDFLSGPAPAGIFSDPSVALVGEKKNFGSSRRIRWFGT